MEQACCSTKGTCHQKDTFE